MNNFWWGMVVGMWIPIIIVAIRYKITEHHNNKLRAELGLPKRFRGRFLIKAGLMEVAKRKRK